MSSSTYIINSYFYQVKEKLKTFIYSFTWLFSLRLKYFLLNNLIFEFIQFKVLNIRFM